MKEYMKPSIEVIDIKVKDEITAPTDTKKSALYTTDGKSITYHVFNKLS